MTCVLFPLWASRMCASSRRLALTHRRLISCGWLLARSLAQFRRFISDCKIREGGKLQSADLDVAFVRANREMNEGDSAALGNDDNPDNKVRPPALLCIPRFSASCVFLHPACFCILRVAFLHPAHASHALHTSHTSRALRTLRTRLLLLLRLPPPPPLSLTSAYSSWSCTVVPQPSARQASAAAWSSFGGAPAMRV